MTVMTPTNDLRKEDEIVRDLARRVAEIAAHPAQAQKRDLWMRVNRLDRARPPIAVWPSFELWETLVPPGSLKCADPFHRRQEMELRKRLYHWEKIGDDRVIVATIGSPMAINGWWRQWNWGIQAKTKRKEDGSGSLSFVPVIIEERDIEMIQTEPNVSVDWEATERTRQRMEELFDGILKVELFSHDCIRVMPMDFFIRWRGIEQTFMDLVERPQWIHEAMERMTTGYMNYLEQAERAGALTLNNNDTYLSTGGYGWTDELPQKDFDGKHVRLIDTWGRASTQIFTESISPAMHDEFAVTYEKRLLDRFGLTGYACCEPMHNKIGIVRKIRNLRRISMSPWCDVAKGAASIGRDYIYSHKPNPTIVSMNHWDPELARRDLRDVFDKTCDNIVEVSLQDLHTLHGEPHRLSEWTHIARDLAEEYS